MTTPLLRRKLALQVRYFGHRPGATQSTTRRGCAPSFAFGWKKSLAQPGDIGARHHGSITATSTIQLSADMGNAAALATSVMNFRRGVAAEKQNGVGTPYIPPMTRRLKCRIDPEQNAYTCVLPEHKPGRRGREKIDLLAVEEPKPAKIRAVSYEAAITNCSNACARLVRR